MPQVIFIKPDGSEHTVTVEPGATVMEAGRDAGLGIEGTCGGCLSCATCHVHVAEQDFARVGEPNEIEKDMLELAEEVSDTSRLCCQVALTEDINGITVTVVRD